MELVCFHGKDKENLAQISALIKKEEWDKIVVIKNKSAEKTHFSDKCEVIEVNSDSPLLELKEEIINKLKPKLGKGFEVALSIASGSGKEHMALISALLNVPVGIRLVAFTKKGVEFVN